MRLSQCSPLRIVLKSTERQLARLFSSKLMDIGECIVYVFGSVISMSAGVKLVYDGDRILVTTLPTVLMKDLATTNTVRAGPVQVSQYMH